MKTILVFVVTAILLSGLVEFGLAQDSGIPDTMYVEIYPPDQIPSGDPPYLVRFPIYVTHDIVDPRWDSLAGFVIPLRYWRSNPARYCSLPPYWNNSTVYPYVGHERSIFRHIIEGSDTLVHNRMMDMAQALMGLAGFLVPAVMHVADNHRDQASRRTEASFAAAA